MEQHTGSPAAKLVLVKLADNANEDGLCWPSVALIVRHTELAQSTVYKHLGELEAAGLIKSVQRLLGQNAAGENEFGRGYQLAIPIPPGGKTIPPNGKKRPSGGRPIPPGGILYKEEPSLEPSLNLPADADPALEAGVRRLAEEVGAEKFSAWFGPAEFIAGPPVRVALPKAFQANWITQHFQPALIRAFGDHVTVTVREAA